MNNLWSACINAFKLNLEYSVVLQGIRSMQMEFPDIKSENQIFFMYIKNQLGSELIKLGEEYTDLLAWVKIEKRDVSLDWYMFVFEEIEDYLLYEEFYNAIKDNVDIQLFNFFNKSCPQFIENFKSN